VIPARCCEMFLVKFDKNSKVKFGSKDTKMISYSYILREIEIKCSIYFNIDRYIDFFRLDSANN
jgi:hypothetical protein